MKKSSFNYCGKSIKYDNGTSAMRAHLMRCKDNPSKKQRVGSSTTGNVEGEVSSSPSITKFDQEASRDELVKMFVAMEIPFRQVENEAFWRFMSVTQPRFNVPSRRTIARDILTQWKTEKEKLKKFLGHHCQRVCLTTDTWTSSQNFNYLCLTAHFIDNNCWLHKKIINFCQVSGHTGEVIGKTIEQCLDSWGLNRVLCLTMDNASSNDLRIILLKKRLMSWSSFVLRGEYLRTRCCAHILNLIVKDGLKEIDTSILKIRAAVKYVRSSPSRLSRFKACIEKGNIKYKGLDCLDVETGWNSTYLMLDAALKHQKAFEELDMRCEKYREEMRKGGVTTLEDWDHARSVLPFLQIFYDATMSISGSYVTSNIYMLEALRLGSKINEMLRSNDVGMKLMANRMKKKYEKYWGNYESINMLLLVASVLDPRYKLRFVTWMIDDVYSYGQAIIIKSKLDSCLKSIFEEYNGGAEKSQGGSQESQLNVQADIDRYGYSKYLQATGFGGQTSELNKYLEETLESQVGGFDILNWWRINSSRFPTLANIAREVLAIPVSTVASESTFSTGGRVFDPYRSSLTPKMVEALICIQDWLKGTPSSLLSNEDFEDLENFEQELISPQDVACSASIALDED